MIVDFPHPSAHNSKDYLKPAGVSHMNNEKENNKSLLQQFIDFVARSFFIKRKVKKDKKSTSDDIYPLW